MNYRRRLGQQVSYTPEQTARYFSQLRRWQEAQQLRPSAIQQQGERTLYQFASDRSSTGLWQTSYRPSSGGSPSPSPSPTPGGSCPIGCLPAGLQYLFYAGSSSTSAWYFLPSDGWVYYSAEQWSDPWESSGYYRVPGSTVEPPEPWYWLPSDRGSEECQFRWQVQTSTNTAPPRDMYFDDYVYEDLSVTNTSTLYSLYHYGALIYQTGFGQDTLNSAPTPLAVRPAPDPDELDEGSGFELSESTGSVQLFFGSDASNLQRFSCGDTPPPDPDPDPEPAQPNWSCNCPDQVQQQAGLGSRSPYLSEQRGRTWTGANTHRAASGPCKHIYAAAVARGLPFPRPQGGNYWDYPTPRIRLEFEPDDRPRLDWNETDRDARQWRDQQRQRRRQQRTDRRADRVMFDRMMRDNFERLGISDRTVARNRALQARYRELYRQAHAPGADPAARDALDNFSWDIQLEQENQ